MGKWIYGPGHRHASAPAYQGLRSNHADFHRCAAEVIRCNDGGAKENANALLYGDFSTLSSLTIKAIRQMQMSLSGGANKGASYQAQPKAEGSIKKIPAHLSDTDDEWEEF